ncbi:MAG: hypothetical protein KJZ86_09285 [Caldilineaceae bacterium]|nr:hypothetical protein [Caldilineaceae bacterium]
MFSMDELISVLAFIFVNVLAFGNARLLARRFSRAVGTDWQTYWLTLITWFWAQVVIVQLILGTLGLLRYQWVLSAVLAIFIVLVATEYRKPFTYAAPIVSEWWVNYRFEAAIMAVGLATVGVLLTVNAMTPPANWDSLTYHLEFPVQWYKQARLSLVLTPFGDGAPTYYPLNATLVYSWLLLPTGSLAIPDIGQAPFVLLAPLATYAVARQIRIDRRGATWSALLALFVPMVLVNGTLWSYSDISMGAAFMLALYFVVKLTSGASFERGVMAGLALGLFIGVKGPALIYCLPLFAILGVFVIKYLVENPFPMSFRLIASIVLPLTILGGYSYLRNWLITGNPFYPVTFSIAGRVIWEGVISINDYRQHPFYRFSFIEMLYQPGYFPHFLLQVILAPFAVWREYKYRNNPSLFMLLLAASLYGLFYLLMPISVTIVQSGNKSGQKCEK